MKKFIILPILGSLLFSNLAFALTFTSEVDQTFNKNQTSTQLRDITITEDSLEPIIKAGSITLTIPANIAAIYDTNLTSENISLHGPAVDNGRVKANPEIAFTDKDKTLSITIDEDFQPSENVILTKIYLEGFNAPTYESQKLILTLGNENSYQDVKTLFIYDSSIDDARKPDMPSNIVISDAENGVIVTWEDPTDLDLDNIEILRGLNSLPVDAGNPIVIAEGVQEYNDQSLVEGDIVKYILRASDGVNYSEISDEMSFVVGSGTTAPQETTEEIPSDTETPVDTETPPATEDTACMDYSDLPSDYEDCDVITYVTDNHIFEGYPDGTFRPDIVINRAETVKVVTNGFGLEITEDDGTTLGFNDVIIGEWYMPYLFTAKKAGIIEGYPDGTFKPEQTVNYVEMIKIFFETADVELGSLENRDEWYQPYLTYAQDNDYVQYSKLTSGMKRIDVAKMFYQFDQQNL